MSLLLSPSPPETLIFPRATTTNDAAVILKLTNPSGNKRAVGFKLKTTQPSKFIVRANLGRLEPGETIEICITRLAQERSHNATGQKKKKRNEKFLVLSAFVPQGKGFITSDEFAAMERSQEQDKNEQRIRSRPVTSSSSSSSLSSSVEEDEASPPAYVAREGDRKQWPVVAPERGAGKEGELYEQIIRVGFAAGEQREDGKGKGRESESDGLGSRIRRIFAPPA